MPTLEITREQPKTRIVTMGQADREIEYEEYYPPGATEPVRREKRPQSEAPAVEPESHAEKETQEPLANDSTDEAVTQVDPDDSNSKLALEPESETQVVESALPRRGRKRKGGE